MRLLSPQILSAAYQPPNEWRLLTPVRHEKRALTCNLEGGVSAPDAAVLVARHAVVQPGVDVDPGVQEEEAPVGQLYALGICALCRGDDRPPSVPPRVPPHLKVN